MDCSTPGFPVHHQLPELTQTHVHHVRDATQPSHPSHPLLLPPSMFPRIRIFSSELVLHILWPKYWIFSFNISPSNEYLGLISFRIDWFDLLAVQGTGDIKGTLHAKMGTIKERNGTDLTEAEDTKKRWQEYRGTIQKRLQRPR